MADSVFDISVKLSLETIGLNSAAGVAMRAFSALEGQATKAESAVMKLASSAGQSVPAFVASSSAAGTYTAQIGAVTAAHTKLNQAMKGTAMLAGGGLLIGASVGIVGMMKGAADQASQLKSIMTTVQLATGATSGQLASLQRLAVTQGTQTQTSVIDQANILKTMTTTGIAGPGSVERLQAILPAAARYSEVMKMARGASAQESTTTVVELAHLFGQYSPNAGPSGPGVNAMIDLAARAMAVTPGTQRSFYTTLSQMSGQMRPLYGTDQAGRTRFINDSLALTMLEGQLGQQGRGGTQVATMIGRTLGAGSTAFGSRTSTQNKDLHDLTALANRGGSHLSFFNAQGQFAGMAPFLSILERAATAPGQSPEHIGQLFRGAFGAVGLRQAGVLADPITVSQFAKVGAFLDPKTGGVSLKAQQAAYNATPAGQAASTLKNMQTLTTLIGQDYVSAMTAALAATAGVTGALATLASNAPALTQLVGWAGVGVVGLTALSGAVMGVRGAFLLWGAAAEVLKLGELAKFIGIDTAAIRANGVVATLSAGATKAWAAAQVAASVVARTAALAYGVLDGVVIALSGGFDIATISAAAFDVAASPVIAVLGGLVLAGGAVYMVFKNWSTISGVLGNMLGWVGGKIHDLLVLLGIAQNMGNKTAVTVPAAAATRPGGVQATIPTGGTVGLPSSIYIPPMGAAGAAPPGKEAVWDGTRWIYVPVGARVVPYHGAHADYDLPIKHNKSGYYVTPPPGTGGPGTGGGGGGVVTHNHGGVTFHAGAIVVHGAPHHDENKLAELVWQKIAEKAGVDSRRQGSTNIGWDLGYNGF